MAEREPISRVRHEIKPQSGWSHVEYREAGRGLYAVSWETHVSPSEFIQAAAEMYNDVLAGVIAEKHNHLEQCEGGRAVFNGNQRGASRMPLEDVLTSPEKYARQGVVAETEYVVFNGFLANINLTEGDSRRISVLANSRVILPQIVSLYGRTTTGGTIDSDIDILTQIGSHDVFKTHPFAPQDPHGKLIDQELL